MPPLHVLPRWGDLRLGDISASDVAEWLKHLRQRYAASTVLTLRTILSMSLDDAVDERLIAANPGPAPSATSPPPPSPRERVWAMPEHVVRIAEQATRLGGPSAGLLVLTTAWTGCRWGEITGLQRDQVDLDHGTITIDPDIGALPESANASGWDHPNPRIDPNHHPSPFLIARLREHLRRGGLGPEHPDTLTTRHQLARWTQPPPATGNSLSSPCQGLAHKHQHQDRASDPASGAC